MHMICVQYLYVHRCSAGALRGITGLIRPQKGVVLSCETTLTDGHMYCIIIVSLIQINKQFLHRINHSMQAACSAERGPLHSCVSLVIILLRIQKFVTDTIVIPQEGILGIKLHMYFIPLCTDRALQPMLCCIGHYT